MTNWVNIIAALLPCISREDPRHVILLKSLAHQAQHALTANADRAVLSMRTLDSTLLKTLPASEEVPSLLALETKLDAWLESYIRSTTYSSDDGQSSTNGVPSPVRLSSQGEAFQAACQLRARLAISLAGIPPPPAIGLHGEGLLSTHNDRESKEEHMGVDFSICSTILRNVLDIANLSTAPLQGASSIETGPGSKGKSDFSFFPTTRLQEVSPSNISALVPSKSNLESPPKILISLAASAAIGALFGDGLSTISREESTGSPRSSLSEYHKETSQAPNTSFSNTDEYQYSNPDNLSLISSDPNPVSPTRVALTMLSMLRRAIGSEPGLAIPDEFFTSTTILKLEKEALPLFIWAAMELVDLREHQQALLDEFLLSPEYLITREVLEQDKEFYVWSQKEIIGLVNRLRTDPSLEVAVVGEEGPGTAAAVRAAFPAAVLSPAALLEVLVGGAVGEAGRTELLIGILKELPALKQARRVIGETSFDSLAHVPYVPATRHTILVPPHTFLEEILKKHLELPSLKSLDDGARIALEKCLIILCSIPSNASLDTGFAMASLPAVAPEEMLQYALLPVLQEASRDPAGNADEFALALRLTKRLLEILQGAKATSNFNNILFPEEVDLSNEADVLAGMSASVSGSFKERSKPHDVALGKELLAYTVPLLALSSSRRIDLSSRGLELPLAVIEEAHAVAMLCSATARERPEIIGQLKDALTDTKTTTAAQEIDPATLDVYLHINYQDTRSTITDNPMLPEPPSSSTVWASADALCNVFALYAVGALDPGKSQLLALCSSIGVRGLREALVLACAVMLPCSCNEETSGIRKGLTDAVRWALSVAASSGGSNSSADAGSARVLTSSSEVRGLIIEVLCRAVHAVGLVPGLVPVAGEEIISATPGPSELRARAVARLTQHVSSACQDAVAIPSSAMSDASTSSVGGGRTRAALTARAFREVSRCAAALQEYYDISALRVCLLHLAQVLKHEARDAELPQQVRTIVANAAVELGDPGIISIIL